MRITQLTILKTALLAAVSVEDARANGNQLPPACATGANASSYRAGVTTGTTLVRSAWRNVNNCDRIDYFQEVVANNIGRLTLAPGASTALACRHAGIYDGAFRQLEAQYGTCVDQCFLDGELFGRMTGEIYCELSIALGGLVEVGDFIRGPVQICGLGFEIGCDSSFIDFTINYRNPDGVCEPYTEGEYSGVWDETRNNQCAYDPIEPDPAPLRSEAKE
jgi:hypothetical protein